MVYKQTLMLCLSAWLVSGQRPSFAGSKPIGYPELITSESPLGNRFGSDDVPLPVEAKGDRALVERLSKLPIDQQPFWYINWKAIEANNKNPQSYPQRGNSFIDPNTGSAPSGAQNPANTNNAPNSSDLTSKFGSPSGNSFSNTQQKQQYRQRNYGH
ncbi:seminal fluid protein HACP044 [Danaus plexippus plexippus]|uniref:Seminal fluid protein HACP044 n=1 Tax=Danaus plexippus plexippus TaxID=278856 RepID=A0A212FDC0_DANPL|nr:seminal fluid protein HACP044 [Danaus plexippus plexippus]